MRGGPDANPAVNGLELAEGAAYRHAVYAGQLGGLDLSHASPHRLLYGGVKLAGRVPLTLFGGVPLLASLGDILGGHDGTTAS